MLRCLSVSAAGAAGGFDQASRDKAAGAGAGTKAASRLNFAAGDH